MANSKTNKTIPVWVNAGEKAITFNRKDGQNWERPLFVNVPNGVRERIAKLLGKVNEAGDLDFTMKPTINCSFELPVKEIETTTIQRGDNAGKLVNSFTVKTEQLRNWLNQLEFSARGAISTEVNDILNDWNPTVFGQTEMVNDDDDF